MDIENEHVPPVRMETDRAIARRQRIINAAAMLFREKGFQASSTADIVQRAGLSVAQLYRDFKSKDELILVITKEVADRYCAAWTADDAIAARNSARAMEWVLGLLSRSLNGDDFGLVPELVAAATRDPEIAKVMNNLDQAISQRLQAILELLVPDADEKRRSDACFTITTFIIGATTRFQAQGAMDPKILERARSFIENEIGRLKD